MTTAAHTHPPGAAVAHFWAQAKIAGPNDCWLWLQHRVKGYGQTYWQGKEHSAHRVAFLLAYGYWPRVCRHRCDVPACVNPAHLLDGTQRDNAADRVARGRSAPMPKGVQFAGTGPGMTHPSATLTDADVRAIRASREPQSTLARRYSLTQSMVSLIKNRKRWTHLPDEEAPR